MSTQADLAGLLDDARGVLHKIEGVAVSERNRVEDAILHAASATSSMQVDVPAQEPAEAVPSVPAEAQATPEVSADTEAEKPSAPKAKTTKAKGT